MSTYFHRLSPSGPYLTDGTSGQPLQIGSDGERGHGSAGMCWRQQGGTASADIAAGASVLSSDAADGFALPVGYHYELIGGFYLGTGAGAVTVRFEYSTDNGSTWNLMPGHLGGGSESADHISVAFADVQALVQAQVFDFDATALVLTNNAPGVRVRLWADGAPTAVADVSWMKATQFVR